MSAVPRHIPVLLREVVGLLDPRPGEVYADCTVGLGGHAAAVGEKLGSGGGGGGTLVLNDADPGNLAHAKAFIESRSSSCAGGGGGCQSPTVVAIAGNFAELPWRMKELGLSADMLLADLGFASSQMEDARRGLSFMREGPLDMRFDPTLPTTAADLVASLPEAELARIILEYGEDGAAKVIARKLVQERRIQPIKTTTRLAEIIRGVVRNRTPGMDPATKAFQALRIAVNDELGSLEALLRGIQLAAVGKSEFLRAGARVGIIAFHSLEDRPVKRAFAELVKSGAAEDVSGGAVKAGVEEVDRNPRSRSATLRVIRLVGKGLAG